MAPPWLPRPPPPRPRGARGWTESGGSGGQASDPTDSKVKWSSALGGNCLAAVTAGRPPPGEPQQVTAESPDAPMAPNPHSGHRTPVVPEAGQGRVRGDLGHRERQNSYSGVPVGASLSVRLSPRSPAPQMPPEAPSSQQLQPGLCFTGSGHHSRRRFPLPGNRMLPENHPPPRPQDWPRPREGAAATRRGGGGDEQRWEAEPKSPDSHVKCQEANRWERKLTHWSEGDRRRRRREQRPRCHVPKRPPGVCFCFSWSNLS